MCKGCFYVSEKQIMRLCFDFLWIWLTDQSGDIVCLYLYMRRFGSFDPWTVYPAEKMRYKLVRSAI